MGFGGAKALLFVQLSVLLLSCVTVFGEEIDALPPMPPHVHYSHPVASPAHPPTHHHHHHPHPHPHPHPPTASPVHTPVHAPTHSPVHAPTHSPVHPPSHHYHHHGHPPSHVPVLPPSHPPTHHAPPAHPPTHHAPPAHPPVLSPSHPPVHPPRYPPRKPFPRSFVAVQGVVYCKSCKYAGKDTLLGASPSLGATVELQCNNTKYPVVVSTKTDKNGYFFITAPKTITTFGAHKCKISLVSSPSPTCSLPSDLHAGMSGAILRPQKPFMSQKLPFVLYNVGPFAFEPKCH